MITPRRLALIAGVAAAVVLAGAAGIPASASVPASAPVAGWSVTPSPNPRAANGLLNAVSCPTTAVCTAVGLHVRASGLGVTLAERRSGGVWTVQSTPNPPGSAASAFNGVSCPSGSACTAVGQFVVGSGAQRTLAERWNGRSWRIQPTPNLAGSPVSRLFAVVCPAADTCTAVGISNSKLLVERWDGARWRIQPAPVPPGARFSELNGVTCTAATACTAVGDYVNRSGLDVTLAERWNGSTWAIQPTPSPSRTQSSGLFGVSCTARDACEASGAGNAGAFAERWNGSRWSLQATPNPAAAQFAQLFSVSCTASSCEAVGLYFDSSGAIVPLGERWNGTAWRAQPVPNPARASGNPLDFVSCPSASDCTAVGLGNLDGTPFTLAERWRNSGWRIENVPSPAGAAANLLNGIACPATNRCVAVGTAGPTRGVFSAEALRWNGRTWRLQQIPTLPGANLNAVSCVTETDCVAVGGSNAGTLAEHWDGEHWTVQPTPNPAGAPAPAFFAVSCVSASSCMAVGGSNATGMGAQVVVAEHWDGHAWRLVPAPAPSSQPNNTFNGVACPTSSACIAVGASADASGNPNGTFAARWNGTSWQAQPMPTGHTPGGFLGSIWCQSATACITTGATNTGTLAERLSGTTWSVLPTPTPPGTQGAGIGSVSCTSLSACTATGLAFGAPAGFPPQTLAERWNGMRWRIQPTPLLPGAGDMNNFSVACPAQSACIAVAGFATDGPGSKTLTEQWRGSGASPTQTAPAATSPRAYPGIAGCIRAAIGEGSASGAVTTRLGPTIKALVPQRSQPGSEIEQITTLCSTA